MPSADFDPDSSSAHCKSSSRHAKGTMPSPKPPLLGLASNGQGTPSSRSELAAERTASRKRSGSPAGLDTTALGGTSHPALESTWGVNILPVIARFDTRKTGETDHRQLHCARVHAESTW